MKLSSIIMGSEAIVAPALSTTQNEEFAFAKTKEVTPSLLREKRRHLGIEYISNLNISLAETRELIHKYYSLDRLISLLNKRESNGDLKHNLIALQFPDNLVYDSTIVSQILQDALNALNKNFHDEHHVEDALQLATQKEIDFTVESETMSRDIESVDKKTCSGNCGSTCKNKNKFQQDIWILADTSYSPCCIDEVAAEHVKADLVVHFGDACLNPVEKINAAYVFGRPYVDFEKLVSKFKEIYNDKHQKITIMADIPHSYVISQLYEVLSDEYSNLIFADVDYKKCGSNAIIIDKYPEHESSFGEQKITIKTADRILHGFNKRQLEVIEEEDYDRLTQEYSLFHITKPEDPRLLFLSTKFSEIKVIEPSTLEINHDQFPTLMKRYRYMHVARNASTVGILVNTLSLSNTNDLLNKVIKWVREADKKHYMFVVGKPNVAKLANFENVDVWCVLGCGQSGVIIDMFGEYYKPIITPYELQLALMPQVTWTGKWVTDFEALMKEDTSESEKEEKQDDGKNNTNKMSVGECEEDDDPYAPQFNPVTGKLTINKPLRQLKHLELELEQEQLDSGDQKTEDNESQLVKKFSGNLSIKNTVSTSAFALQDREWTGLGSDFKDAEENGEYSPKGAIIQEGTFGIARDYNPDV